MKREVRYFSTSTDVRKRFDSEATTWGQLKPEIRATGLDLTDLTAMIRENRTTLVDDGAVLPTESFTIIFTPGKVKSGK